MVGEYFDGLLPKREGDTTTEATRVGESLEVLRTGDVNESRIIDAVFPDRFRAFLMINNSRPPFHPGVVSLL